MLTFSQVPFISQAKIYADNTLISSNCLYPIMHLFLDGNSAFQDVNVPINKAQMVTQWFKQRDNNISHVSRLFLNHRRGQAIVR